LCAWIAAFQAGREPALLTGGGLIAELDETYAVLSDNQGAEGWCILVLKDHEEHLGELPLGRQTRIFADCARVARAIRTVFAATGPRRTPPRINYECLGNLTNHIHWHVIPRHATDPMPRHTVWAWPPERLKGSLPPDRRVALIAKLREALLTGSAEPEPLWEFPPALGGARAPPGRAHRLAAVHEFLSTHDMPCYRCRTGLLNVRDATCPTCGFDLLTMVESIPAFSRDCPLCGSDLPSSDVALCWSCGAMNPRYLERRVVAIAQPIPELVTRCRACGYDVSGIPGEKCPECGVPIGSEGP
jgi:diadenosine tetraphosphate (Ap4A) HIT family hydrolase/ribosomal protein L37E